MNGFHFNLPYAGFSLTDRFHEEEQCYQRHYEKCSLVRKIYHNWANLTTAEKTCPASTPTHSSATNIQDAVNHCKHMPVITGTPPAPPNRNSCCEVQCSKVIQHRPSYGGRNKYDIKHLNLFNLFI